MCGIGFTLFPSHCDSTSSSCACNCEAVIDNDIDIEPHSNSNSHADADALEKALVAGIAPRGPDYQRNFRTSLTFQQCDIDAHYHDGNDNDDSDDFVDNEGKDEEHQHRIQNIASISLTDATDKSWNWDLNLYASVLHMRGAELTPQPYQSLSSRTVGHGDTFDTHGGTVGHDEDVAVQGTVRGTAHEEKGADVDNSIGNGGAFKYTLCWNGECYAHDAMGKYPPFDLAEDKHGSGTREGYQNVSDTKLVMALLQNTIESSSTSISRNTDLDQKMMQHDNDDGDMNQSHSDNTNEHTYAQKRHCQMRAFANSLSRIHGEYAYIFHWSQSSVPILTQNPSPHSNSGATNPVDKNQNQCSYDDRGCVYFGRDPLGRRSLLMTALPREKQDCSNDRKRMESFVVSSVDLGIPASTQQLEEIPAGIVYCLDLNTGILSSIPIPTPTHIPCPQLQTHITLHDPIVALKHFERDPTIPSHIHKAAEILYQKLSLAIRRRVIDAPTPAVLSSKDIHLAKRNPASVAVLFSGGVDSVVIAAICHEHVPIDQPIDLINVAFASTSGKGGIQNGQDPFGQSPDRQAALLSFEEMQSRWPDRHWRFVAVNVNYTEVLEKERLICGLIAPLKSTMDFNIGTAFWFASRGYGEEVVTVKVGSKERLSAAGTSGHLRFGVMECKSEQKNTTSKDTKNLGHVDSDPGVCSTVKCGRQALNRCIFHACKGCCLSYQRRINQFLGGRADACPVHSKQASKKQKQKSKSSLNKTKKTGASPKTPVVMYQSDARVILVGIGADEQMAGYGRHRTTFDRGGYDALRCELEMEKKRLWTRNLGRDDRCISYHGKEARFPFLDDDLVGYLNSLDVTELCDMTKPQGVGDKMILRLVAKHVGVIACSGLMKRAIQFGSRIAKCSDVDRFGSSRKASGEAKHMSSLNDNFRTK